MSNRHGQTWTDLLTDDEIVEALDDLAAAAADGYRIALRPAGDSSLIIVTDLDDAGLRRLRDDGLSPVVATVDACAHTAWLRLDRASLDPQLAREIARDLAVRYSGMIGDVSTRYGGPLAGLPGVTVSGPLQRDALASPAVSEALIAAGREEQDRAGRRVPAADQRPHESELSQPDSNDQPRSRRRPGRADR